MKSCFSLCDLIANTGLLGRTHMQDSELYKEKRVYLQHRVKATSERAWAALFEVSTTIQPETISRDVQRVSGVQDGTDTQTTPLWSDKVSKATRAANGKP